MQQLPKMRIRLYYFETIRDKRSGKKYLGRRTFWKRILTEYLQRTARYCMNQTLWMRGYQRRSCPGYEKKYRSPDTNILRTTAYYLGHVCPRCSSYIVRRNTRFSWKKALPGVYYRHNSSSVSDGFTSLTHTSWSEYQHKKLCMRDGTKTRKSRYTTTNEKIEMTNNFLKLPSPKKNLATNSPLATLWDSWSVLHPLLYIQYIFSQLNYLP